jgi:hypothetical protein
MSQIVYRGNLSTKAFPLLTDFQARSIIVPGPDNTFNRSLVSSEDLDRDVGVPIAFYMHNVLPAPYGFSSVGYENIIPALSTSATGFKSVKLLRSNALSGALNGPRFYFAPQKSGTHYTYVLGGTAWSQIATSIPYTDATQITYATVQGISYIFFSNIGCYKWDSGSNTLIPVTLTSLDPSNILGITAYQGYMIAYDSKFVYWSSVLDVDYTLNSVDFTPSLITGASNIAPEGARGPITVVLPATFGITVYTSSNIVSGVYSGNSRFPFNFKEVVASGGLSTGDYVTYDANTGNQYAYTTSGFQTVTATATQTIFSEMTDFLAGSDFEDLDETTLTFTQATLSYPMQKKITSVADRYLIISYGIDSFTHAIVYDMTQKRYGKLKQPHVDCFEYEYLNPTLADAPRKSIAFLLSDGSVQIVNTSITFAKSSGVIMMGKFQYVRSRLLTLEKVEFQATQNNQSCVAYDWVSKSGGTLESCAKYPMYDVTPIGEKQKQYNVHKTGMNHSIMVVGGFFLSELILTFHINGRR